jgi:hypothetical protein
VVAAVDLTILNLKRKLSSCAWVWQGYFSYISIVYLRLEDYNNLLLVASDDSLIRAFYYNGNQFVPVNPVINDEPHEADIKILKAK